MPTQRNNGREIVAAFTHDEAYVLSIAAKAYAEMLDVTDAIHPDPDMRANANVLRQLSVELRNANAARSFIEEGE